MEREGRGWNVVEAVDEGALCVSEMQIMLVEKGRQAVGEDVEVMVGKMECVGQRGL